MTDYLLKLADEMDEQAKRWSLETGDYAQGRTNSFCEAAVAIRERYGEQCRAASGELEELRAWKAEHQAFLVRLSVALVVDGGCKQDQIEACVDELIAERDNLRALSRGVPEGE